jgi:hypothetical protein
MVPPMSNTRPNPTLWKTAISQFHLRSEELDSNVTTVRSIESTEVVPSQEMIKRCRVARMTSAADDKHRLFPSMTCYELPTEIPASPGTYSDQHFRSTLHPKHKSRVNTSSARTNHFDFWSSIHCLFELSRRSIEHSSSYHSRIGLIRTQSIESRPSQPSPKKVLFEFIYRSTSNSLVVSAPIESRVIILPVPASPSVKRLQSQLNIDSFLVVFDNHGSATHFRRRQSSSSSTRYTIQSITRGK